MNLPLGAFAVLEERNMELVHRAVAYLMPLAFLAQLAVESFRASSAFDHSLDANRKRKIVNQLRFASKINGVIFEAKYLRLVVAHLMASLLPSVA